MTERKGIFCPASARVMLLDMLHKIRLWYWKRRYRPGKTLTRFLAPDIRHDVEVLDTSQIESGVITARTRTWNVLYAIGGIKPKPAFGEVRKIEIKELWKWTGAPCGAGLFRVRPTKPHSPPLERTVPSVWFMAFENRAHTPDKNHQFLCALRVSVVKSLRRQEPQANGRSDFSFPPRR